MGTVNKAEVSVQFKGEYISNAAGQYLQATIANGSKGMPDPFITFAHGTGNGQVNEWYYGKITVSGGGNTEIDLSGVVTNPEGATIAFTKVKQILAIIDYGTGVAWDGSKVLRMGPAAANGFAGPFGGTTPYEEFDRVKYAADYTGWTVTAGTGDKLNFANPGGSAVDCHVWILGNIA